MNSNNFALKLLKCATDTFKIENAKMHHSLTLHDDSSLILTIILGTEYWKSFLLTQEDLDKDPIDIIVEISNLMKVKGGS